MTRPTHAPGPGGARPLTILVSAVGAPGAARLLRGLRENGEREVRLVGTDMGNRAIGRHLCDAFHRVPAGTAPEFADTVLDICRREGVDAVLPESSFDLEGLADARGRFADEGIAVLVSSPESIAAANDKGSATELLEQLGLPAPRSIRATGSAQVEAAALALGYPDVPVCFKPVFGSGSRGFRILDPTVDRAHQLLYEKPGAVALRLDEAVELLPDEGGPELLVMELATGPERTVDGFADGNGIVLGHAKTREGVRSGLAMYFVTLDDPELMAQCELLINGLGIEHFFNIQLIGRHFIEVNPRISTIVFQEDFNLPWLGVKWALGLISTDEAKAQAAKVRPGRTALRFYDQIEFDA